MTTAVVRALLAAFGIIALGLGGGPAKAQPGAGTSTFIVDTCGTLPIPYIAGQLNRAIVIDKNGNTCGSASVSASITGFPTTQTTGTPISVTTGGVTGTLPSGAVVVATNIGTTNAAYCKLGASATTSDQYIAPNGGWFSFTVGAATQLTCITSTSTTTVNMVGGSGLPTGTGGGSGGGGGAITAALGAFASGSLAAGSMVDFLTVRGTKAPGTAAANSALTGCVYTAAGVTLTDGQQAACQMTAAGSTHTTVDNTNNNGIATPTLSSPVVQAGMQYETVAASVTAQVLGGSGATGDYLSHCVVYPVTTTPGVVTVFDNANAAGTNAIAFPGGASSVSNLVPFAIPVGAFSAAGPWKVTTGANLVVTCYGKFS